MESSVARRPFTRLVLRNARCLHRATIDLDPRLTMLIGENGSGKTTVVEALASLSNGDDEGLKRGGSLLPGHGASRVQDAQLVGRWMLSPWADGMIGSRFPETNATQRGPAP